MNGKKYYSSWSIGGNGFKQISNISLFFNNEGFELRWFGLRDLLLVFALSVNEGIIPGAPAMKIENVLLDDISTKCFRFIRG